ncbi:MAG: radical SAM protein [Elusimicrobiota bacterium]
MIKIYKEEYDRIKELLNSPKYRGRSLPWLVIIIITRVLKPFWPFSRPLRILHFKYRQKLLLDRSIQVNKSSKTQENVLRVCITYQCNTNCFFCYAYCPRQEFKEHMTVEDFEFIIGWAKSNGYNSFRLLGGEATIHPELKAIMNIVRKNGLRVSLSSNGLFSEGVSSLLSTDVIESVNFSYPQSDTTIEKKYIFIKNLKETINKGIPVLISWIMDFNEDNWKEVVDFAVEYRGRVALRFSMVLPGNKKDVTSEELHLNLRKIAKQTLDIAEYTSKNYIVFFFYRPLLLCMFKKDELDYLNSISPFIFDTQCTCSSLGERYSNMLTVNPDLTCYPCPVVHIKGIKIGPGTSRKDINDCFLKPVTHLCKEPMMDSCKMCEYFSNYSTQEDGDYYDLSDSNVCQGGCLLYRTPKSES